MKGGIIVAKKKVAKKTKKTVTIGKVDVIEKVASATGKSKNEVKQVLDTFWSVLKKEIDAGNKVIYRGVFSAEPKANKGGKRKAFGREIKIPASKVIKFRLSPKFKKLGK